MSRKMLGDIALAGWALVFGRVLWEYVSYLWGTRKKRIRVNKIKEILESDKKRAKEIVPLLEIYWRDVQVGCRGYR